MELHVKNASVFAGMRDGTEGAPWLVSRGTMDGTKGWRMVGFKRVSEGCLKVQAM